MKINSLNGSINYKGSASFVKNLKSAAADSFARIDQIGEGTNIALDFIGKAVVVPAVILAVSKEDKEKKEYSALKNPVAATIQLLMEVPILMAGSKFIEKLANSGALDPKTGAKLYNENEAKKMFLYLVQQASQNDETFAQKSKELVEKLEKEGLSKNIKENFENLIKNSKNNTDKKLLSAALSGYDCTKKRLFHLQNRVCFIAALALTPILCKAEDFIFPKIMNLIIKKPQKQIKKEPSFTLEKYINLSKQGGVK